MKPLKRLMKWRKAHALQSWREYHPDEVREVFNSDQDEERSMAIDLGTRTSTNAAVGSPILGVVYVNLVQMLPWEGVVAALTTPEAVVVATAFFAWIVARFSKTPAVPGAL